MVAFRPTWKNILGAITVSILWVIVGYLVFMSGVHGPKIYFYIGEILIAPLLLASKICGSAWIAAWILGFCFHLVLAYTGICILKWARVKG
jgi:hypothetical protein